MSALVDDEHGLSFCLQIVIDDFGSVADGAQSLPYGLRAGFPRLADLLAEYSIKGTICASLSVYRDDALLADFIAAKGHEALLMDRLPGERDAAVEWLRHASDTLHALCGKRPYGWRSRDLPQESTRGILQECGFRYDLDEDTDDAAQWTGRPGESLIALPNPVDTSDLRFVQAPALSSDAWLQYAIDSFDILRAEAEYSPRVMCLAVHPHLIGRPGRIQALEQLLQYVTSQETVWVASGGEIAAKFAALNRPTPVGAALN